MSVFDKIEKSWKELDFEQVDFKSGKWGWSRGGIPLSDYEWAISYYDSKNDLKETRYKMPPIINEMLERRYQEGRNNKLRDIQIALGIGV